MTQDKVFLDMTEVTVATDSLTSITIGVLKEVNEKESRVTIPPSIASDFIKQGYVVCVEEAAGERAGWDDGQYQNVKCITTSRREVIRQSDILFSIEPPTKDFDYMDGTTLVCWVGGRSLKCSQDVIAHAKNCNLTLMDVTAVPRTSVSQKFDFLSGQASVAGYHAVAEATNCFVENMMTVPNMSYDPPPKTMVFGCGVAGWSAIGAAKASGSQVRAWDVSDKFEKKVLSMGVDWIGVNYKDIRNNPKFECAGSFKEAQRQAFMKNVKEVDIILTACSIPGRPSPKLIDEEMVKAMKPGSVILDLAAVGGGNCSLTRRGEKFVTDNHITIIGYDNLAARDAQQASLIYGRNVYCLLDHIAGEKGCSNLFPAINKAMNDCDKGDLTVRNIVCARNRQEHSEFLSKWKQMKSKSAPKPTHPTKNIELI